MMANKLEISCDVVRGDFLEAYPDDPGTHRLCVGVTEDDMMSKVYLSPESVRELFNYAGIWLHKQGEG